jgi:hypothetical protein
VGGVGVSGVWGVWGVWGVCGVGVWGCGGPAHSLRSTFHRLHLLRLWTPTIFYLLSAHYIALSRAI